jgi:hypothetical protein
MDVHLLHAPQFNPLAWPHSPARRRAGRQCRALKAQRIGLFVEAGEGFDGITARN